MAGVVHTGRSSRLRTLRRCRRTNHVRVEAIVGEQVLLQIGLGAHGARTGQLARHLHAKRTQRQATHLQNRTREKKGLRGRSNKSEGRQLCSLCVVLCCVLT